MSGASSSDSVPVKVVTVKEINLRGLFTPTRFYADGVKYLEFVGALPKKSSVDLFARAIDANVNKQPFIIDETKEEEAYEQCWVPLQLNPTEKKAEMLKSIVSDKDETNFLFFCEAMNRALHQTGCTESHVLKMIGEYGTDGGKSSVHCLIADETTNEYEYPPWSVALTLSASLVFEGAVELIVKNAHKALETLLLKQ